MNRAIALLAGLARGVRRRGPRLFMIMLVVNLPWLNRVDAEWIAGLAEGKRLLVTLDDHYVDGGQGEKVLAALARAGVAIPTLTLGVNGVPPSGQPGEVLERLGLDAAGIAAMVGGALE